MELNKVKIINFRQYRDVEIKFSNEKHAKITVIQGNNGTGKTTF
ncbi:MAG: AAA family ATPase [Methanobacteriaceae archaeon]|jgi:DNA repair exonuclease SbcCD ATPase subunit|nr:AAA family ATPase [Methanobacteriaceae archaeon]